jgi:hypothetical protein
MMTMLDVVKINKGKGMTVFDYAVLWQRAGIVEWMLTKNRRYLDATSNWGEYPIHKAAYRGFLDIIKIFIPTGAECEMLNRRSLGEEHPVLIASLGGYIEVLEYLQETCPVQFERLLRTPASSTLTWRSKIPCDTSEYTVAKAREWCGSLEPGDKGGCPGYFRYRCSTDSNIPCEFDDDCRDWGDKQATCDEFYAPPNNHEYTNSQAHLMPFENLNHHWKTCVLVCPASRRQTACGPTFDGTSYLGFNGL